MKFLMMVVFLIALPVVSMADMKCGSSMSGEEGGHACKTHKGAAAKEGQSCGGKGQQCCCKSMEGACGGKKGKKACGSQQTSNADEEADIERFLNEKSSTERFLKIN